MAAIGPQSRVQQSAGQPSTGQPVSRSARPPVRQSHSSTVPPFHRSTVRQSRSPAVPQSESPAYRAAETPEGGPRGTPILIGRCNLRPLRTVPRRGRGRVGGGAAATAIATTTAPRSNRGGATNPDRHARVWVSRPAWVTIEFTSPFDGIDRRQSSAPEARSTATRSQLTATRSARVAARETPK